MRREEPQENIRYVIDGEEPPAPASRLGGILTGVGLIAVVWFGFLLFVDGEPRTTTKPFVPEFSETVESPPTTLAPVVADGVAWTPHLGGPDFLRSVTVWENGYLAISGPFGNAGLVRSPDGISWSPWLLAPFDDPVSLARIGDDLLIAGRNTADVGAIARVWRSSDGVEWEPITPDDASGKCCTVRAAGDRAALIDDTRAWLLTGTAMRSIDRSTIDLTTLAVTAEGFLGWAGGSQAFSSDGRNWEPIDTVDGVIIDVGNTGSGRVAIGYRDRSATAWTSNDARSWSPRPADFGVRGRPTNLYAVESFLIATGRLAFDPAGWWSTDASTWTLLPPEVTATLDISSGWFASPAFGTADRILLHGSIRVDNPECDRCLAREPVIWVGNPVAS